MSVAPGRDGSDSAQAARRAEAEKARRAEIRRFVREHHPDRGGDPAEFAEGLRALRGGEGFDSGGRGWKAGSGAGDVTAYRKPRRTAALADWAADWARRTWERGSAARHRRADGAGRGPRVR